MESILRGEEISRLTDAACDMEGSCFYFPLRHHSPACALHVKRVIEHYRPDCILIEGPQNADELIADMVDPGTEAPFCIYYSYRDSKGLVDEKKGDHRCYYPFLDYSPELAAMREGNKAGAALFFMDLPYEEMLIAEKEGEGLRRPDEKNTYNDDRYLSENEFIRGVVEKSGLRSFEEFWERHFEMEGMRQNTADFLRNVLFYCVLSRANTSVERLQADACLAREAYMRGQIAKAKQKYQKILVVTGGFHVAGLVGAEVYLLKNGAPIGGDLFGTDLPEGLTARAEDKKLHSIDSKDKGVYLMSYSMEAADALNGYCSGMPHPMYHQRMWEYIQTLSEGEGPEQTEAQQVCRNPVILQFLVETGRKVRKKEAYPSAYDEICALTMCENLARLRGKPYPGVYELRDSVLSNYVKGEYQIATDRPMRVLREALTGKKIGKLTDTVKLPPLCKDFEMKCHAFRLDIHGSSKKEITLSVFAKKKHREESAFFHQCDYLETGFAIRKKGPNLRLRKDRNLIREIWEYRFGPGVMSSLIENSVYGGTIEEACRSLAERQFAEETDAATASELLIRMFEMGLAVDRIRIAQRLREVILASEDFFALTKTLSNLVMLTDMQELYGYGSDPEPLRDLTAQKLLSLLEHMTGVKDDDADKILDALKELYRIFMGAKLAEERKSFITILHKMSAASDSNPSVAGCVWGLLYAFGEKTSEEVAVCMQGYLLASGEKAGKAADYVRGLFFVAGDILFTNEEMLKMLDRFLERISYDEFIKTLPSLRLAFSYFTPVEMDRLAGKVAGMYGMKKQEFQELREVSAEELEYGRVLEKRIMERIGV